MFYFQFEFRNLDFMGYIFLLPYLLFAHLPRQEFLLLKLWLGILFDSFFISFTKNVVNRYVENRRISFKLSKIKIFPTRSYPCFYIFFIAYFSFCWIVMKFVVKIRDNCWIYCSYDAYESVTVLDYFFRNENLNYRRNISLSYERFHSHVKQSVPTLERARKRVISRRSWLYFLFSIFDLFVNARSLVDR